jgi:hypothetical protein
MVPSSLRGSTVADGCLMLGGLAECLRGNFESFGLGEFDVFVFDVDRHFGVDAGE